MIKLLALLLLGLLGSLWLAAQIERDGGYLLISYAGTVVETTLWVGLLLLVLGFMLVHGLLRLFYRLRGGGVGLRRRDQRLVKGLVAYLEGHWRKAVRLLSRGADSAAGSQVAYLFAAMANDRLGKDQEREAMLRKADEQGGKSLAGLLVKAQLWQRLQHLEHSLSSLLQARKLAPTNLLVIELLTQVYSELEDWQGAVGLFPELSKLGKADRASLRAAEKRIFLGHMKTLATRSQDLETLNQVWQRLSSELKKDPQVVASHARALMAAGAESEAEKRVRKCLEHQWDESLVTIYGQLRAGDEQERLMLAEGWLKSRPRDTALLLCLGRLCLMNGLWGKAREYFHASIGLAESPEACAEMARLLEGLGEREQGLEYYRRGLLGRVEPLPALPLPASAGAARKS